MEVPYLLTKVFLNGLGKLEKLAHGVMWLGIIVAMGQVAFPSEVEEAVLAKAAGEKARREADSKLLADAGLNFGAWYCVGPFKDALFGLFSRSFAEPFGPEIDMPANGAVATGPDVVFHSIPLPGEAQTKRGWVEMKGWQDGYWCEMPVGPLPGRNEVVYAFRTIQSRTNITLTTEWLVQDACKVWLNGKQAGQVYGKAGGFARALNAGTVKLPLTAGTNHLLVKVVAHHDRRGFAVSMPPLTPVFAGRKRADAERAKAAPRRAGYLPVPGESREDGVTRIEDAVQLLRTTAFEIAPRPGYDPPVLKMCEWIETQGNSSPEGGDYVRQLARIGIKARVALDLYGQGNPESLSQVVQAADALEKLWDEQVRSLGKVLFIRRAPVAVNVVSPYGSRGVSPAEICLFDTALPREAPRVLHREENGASIFDLNISYDARTLFFSARRPGVAGGWHIYEMPVDGSAPPRAITSGPSNNISPVLLPNGEIMFVSDRAGNYLVCQGPRAGVLYVANRDGSNVRRVSGNTLSDHTPQVLNDGRVLFTRWDYGVNVNVFSRQGLWSMNPDGTQLQLFFGNSVEDPNGFYQARAIPGRSEIICTFGPHHQFQAGSIGMVWNRNGLENRRGEGFRWVSRELPVTDDITFPNGYQQPCPVNERQFLVSYGGELDKGNRIYLMDDRGNRRCVIENEDAELGCWWPVLLKPRPVPPVMPARSEPREFVRRAPEDANRTPDDLWGTLMAYDVYEGLPGYVSRGDIKALQIMEQVPKTHPKLAPEAWGDSPVTGQGTYYVRRLIGVVPVEADGSAYFMAPAVRDISIDALDAEGRVIQMMKTTFHVMPGEQSSCMGCHEHDKAPPVTGKSMRAIRRPPDRPRPPPGDWAPGGIIDYRLAVQPVLDQHCIKCHSGAAPKGGVDLSGDLTRFFNMSYNTLCDRGLVYYANLAGEPPTKATPMAFGSMVSRIRKHIETDHSGAVVPLEDRRRIYAWIDAGVPFYGTYAHTSNNRQLTGFRDRWHVGTETDWFRTKFMPVFERRCVSCHERRVDVTQPYATRPYLARVTSKVWPEWVYMSYFFGDRDPIAAFAGPAYRVNLTHPEWSQMLTAPLAKEAGGLGLCRDGDGAAVFKDKNDADYLLMREALKEGVEVLKAAPIDLHPPDLAVLEE